MQLCLLPVLHLRTRQSINPRVVERVRLLYTLVSPFLLLLACMQTSITDVNVHFDVNVHAPCVDLHSVAGCGVRKVHRQMETSKQKLYHVPLVRAAWD